VECRWNKTIFWLILGCAHFLHGCAGYLAIRENGQLAYYAYGAEQLIFIK
jgi:hypothetical protein